jgi:carboxypeptidase T
VRQTVSLLQIKGIHWAGWLLLLAMLLAVTGQTHAAESQPVADPSAGVVQASTEDPVVVRISFADRAALDLLAERLDIWEVNHAQGTLIAMITHEQWRWLKLLGYPTALDEEKTAELHRPLVRSAGQTGGIPGYSCYRTVEETYADLAALAEENPTIAQWIDIGDSYDKITPGDSDGYDIYALVLTNQHVTVDKGKFLLFAAVHARELTTAELATRFAEELVAKYGVDPDVTWLLDYNEIHIIPQGNPDGRKWAEQGYSWRKNTNNPSGCGFPFYGVDLNRNGSFNWNICGSGCSSGDSCSIVYRGVTPGSEPETVAVESYMQQIFEDQRGPELTAAAPLDTNGLFISLHSYGNLVIYPWDWTGQHAPNMLELRRLGRKLGFHNRYGVCNTSNCLYGVDGSHTDYAYGTFGVASYTYELGTTFFQSCSFFENSILRRNLDSLYYAAKAARRPYQMPAGPDTVDVTASPATVSAGQPVTLSATADHTRYFSNGYGVEVSQPISAVRYTVNVPSWLAESFAPLSPGDGSFDSTVETAEVVIDTRDWTPGRHTIFVESQDQDGNWGAPTARFLTINADYGLTLVQPSAVADVSPGQPVTYTLIITNTGNVTDTFQLALVQSDWPVDLPELSAPVAAGTAVTATIQVTVPVTATIGAANVAVIEVASTGDPGQIRVAILQTVVDTLPPPEPDEPDVPEDPEDPDDPEDPEDPDVPDDPDVYTYYFPWVEK